MTVGFIKNDILYVPGSKMEFRLVDSLSKQTLSPQRIVIPKPARCNQVRSVSNEYIQYSNE